MTEPTIRKCPEEGCALETEDGVEYLADQLHHERQRTEERWKAMDGKLETVATGLLELTNRPTKEEHQHSPGPKGVMECPGCHGAVACPTCYPGAGAKTEEPPKDQGEKPKPESPPKEEPHGPGAGEEPDPDLYGAFARSLLG